MTPAGFPHSEISGSKPVCGSPKLIAAYHVLRRLSAPRHPPCTLCSLTKLAGSSEELRSSSFSANPIASSPIQLSKIVDHWDPRSRPPLHSGSPPRMPAIRPQGPLVELIGFEPTASALQGRRSPN